MIDLALQPAESNRLLAQIADIDAATSEIVEIPRLNTQDKVSIQLLFLSKLPGIIHLEDLRLTAEQQKEAFGFALDAILAGYQALAPLASYWDDFKLKTIQYYLEKFTGVTGIASKLF